MKLKIVAFSLFLGLASFLGACQNQTEPTTPGDNGVQVNPADQTETPTPMDEETPGATNMETPDKSMDKTTPEPTETETPGEPMDQETPGAESSP